MRSLITLLFLIFPWVSVFGQLQGSVYDASTQEPISGVRISQKGKVLALSDDQGWFTVSGINSADSLTFARIGYQTRTIPTDMDSLMYVPLQSKSIAIESVTVRAYNTRRMAFNAPGGLDILNAEQIRRMSVSSPETVLNSMPGIFMHSGARNTNRITIRGIGSRSMYTTTKIKAYLNEIPITSGIGETTLEDLDLNLVDRITVIKGPSSSIYGSALGGTVLYRMGVPTNKGFSFRQQSAVGSFNQFRNTSQVRWKGEKSGLRLAYNKLQSKGFRRNDDYNRDALTAFFEHQLTKNTKLSYLGRYHNLNAFIPSSLSKETFRNDPTAADTDWNRVDGHESYKKALNGVSIKTKLHRRLELTSSMFAKIYNGREVRPFNILDDESTSTGTRNVLRWKQAFSGIHLTLQTGFESLFETYRWEVFETLSEGAQGQKLSKNRQERTHHNIFSSFKLQWLRWSLSGGANVNKTRYTYNDQFPDHIDLSDSKNFNWIVAPRLALTWQPSKYVTAYGNLSRGYSTPSYEETLNAEGYVTGSVKPETGWNRELGVRLKSPGQHWYAKISGYSIAVDDLLVTKRIAEDEFYKINAGETLHQGLEVLGRFRWLDNSFLKSTFHASYMYTDYHFEAFREEGKDHSGNALPGIPKHKAFLQLDIDLEAGIFVSGNFFLSGSMPMNDANSAYSNSYTKLNLRTGFQKNFSQQWHAKIYAGLQNVYNSHYASMILINAPSYGGSPRRYYYPGEPRNFIFGLSINYYL